MKLGTLTAAGLLGMGLAMAPVFAQGPMWDVVKVNLPYTVVIGDHTLPPGEYTIRQNHEIGGASRILLIYSDKGMKFETSAMTIPALDPNTARNTEVVLDNVDNKYYVSKVWIEGKDYGYEFPLPSSVKEREKEHVAAVNVPGSYSTMNAESSKSESTTVASNTQSTSTENQTPATVTNQPSSAPNNTMAQNTPARRDEDQDRDRDRDKMSTDRTQSQASTPATTPTYNDTNSANRDAADQQPATTNNTPATPNRMPSTSAGWLMMVLGGGSLSGLGLTLRRASRLRSTPRA